VNQSLGTEARPLRVAIIGAGPAGFYAAEGLLKQKDLVCSIDFFNRFPTPFGLVRDGVAPDHQSIKSVTRIYDRIASDPRVRYFGNVTFGTDVKHEDLKPLYDQIIYAVGAQADRRMGIPGEDLAGSFPATAFVGWYNGHPDYRDINFDLTHERAIVVGNGNVAMDVTRILAMPPDRLATTDIADHALEQLRRSNVREVVVLGRRGPAQAAFTHAEIKEFGELEDVDILVNPETMELDEHSLASLETNKTAAKNVDTLRSYTTQQQHTAKHRIQLRFLTSPVEIIGTNGKVAAVRVEHNRLVLTESGALRARGTGQFETIEAGLVLRSVGYRSTPLKGVPFDEYTYTISNVAGRVTTMAEGDPIPGEYVVGWAKRGPSGIIGTNKPDAYATVTAMIDDLYKLSGISDTNRDPDKIIALLRERNIDYVTYEQWKILDQFEVARGTQQGRPRVKITRVPEMLEIIRQEVTS